MDQTNIASTGSVHFFLCNGKVTPQEREAELRNTQRPDAAPRDLALVEAPDLGSEKCKRFAQYNSQAHKRRRAPPSCVS